MIREPSSERTSLRVLLVEDNPGDARLLGEYLSEAGLLNGEPDRTATLEDAVDRLRSGSARPDVILLDLGLPDAEGLEAAKAVLQTAPEVPVVILTGRDDRQTAVAALREGAQDYLLKGEVGPDVLARAVRYALERKRTERELEAERARLEEVFKAAPAWIAVLRGEDHVFEMVNTAYREMMGDRDLIGKPAREAVPEGAQRGYFEILDRVYESGEPYRAEERPIDLERPDGSVERVYRNFVYQPRREDGEVVGVIAHGVDVTEQVERRREAEERKARLDKVLNTSADGILLAGTDGEFTYANPAAEEMLGLEESAIASRSYRDPEWGICGPDGGPFPDEELPVARVLRTGEAVKDVEHGVELPDGTRRVLSVHAAPLEGSNGELQGVVASLRDVTEIRQARAALQYAKDLFQGVFDISPVALKIVDAETHEYRTVNEVFTEQFGYSREEVELGGVTDTDLWPDPEVRERIYDRVVEGETVRDVEVRLRRKDGSRFDALFSAGSLVVDDRRYVVGAIKDISYQKEFERELKHRALHDGLTGLANRALFEDRLARAVERCERTGGSLAVLGVDLNRFKVINESPWGTRSGTGSSRRWRSASAPSLAYRTP